MLCINIHTHIKLLHHLILLGTAEHLEVGRCGALLPLSELLDACMSSEGWMGGNRFIHREFVCVRVGTSVHPSGARATHDAERYWV